MKRVGEIIFSPRVWKGFGLAGWLLAGLLSFWAAPRIYHRLVSHFPSVQRREMDRSIVDKKRELSSPWRDPRPLIIMVGDSHIEFGNWYDLFDGAWAVRNCGLAGAKIADVTELVQAITDFRPKIVVLMCGVNNFIHGQQDPDQCLKDYDALLDAVRAHVQPESILVLSLMPLQESPMDHATHQLNLDMKHFNVSLAACCRRHQVEFLDVNASVAGPNGGLATALTVDGLHLNRDGYRRLASIISPRLIPHPAP